MSNYIKFLPGLVSLVYATGILLYERFYAQAEMSLFLGFALLFCASYSQLHRAQKSIERLVVLVLVSVVAVTMPSALAAIIILVMYLLATSIVLENKTFANFFGPIILLVITLLTTIVGMQNEVISNAIILWSTLLIALFASGRSSLAAIATLAPLLVLAATKLELNQIHTEIATMFIAWSFIEVSQRNLYRLSLATSALALWYSPQHAWVIIAILSAFIPDNLPVNTRSTSIIAVMLSLLIALTATASLAIASAIALLILLTVRMIYKTDRTQAMVNA